MAYALQQLINGVTLGMIYGLIAVGYTMVYGIIGMINFAHGDIFMVGAFLSLIALTGLSGLGITSVPLALALTLVFAAGIAALYGWTVERVAYGAIQALKGVDLEVNEGEIVTLIGANGAGKSTLMMTVCGNPRARDGSIVYDGTDITDLPTHEIMRKRIAQAPEGRRIFPRMSVHENLLMGAEVAGNPDIPGTLQTVFTLFPRLKERRGQRGGTLSGGEQQMLAIGRALMSRPRLLLLDEPSLGLAPLMVRQIFFAIRALNRETGLTVLLVEQNAFQALRLAHRGYVLVNGAITMAGSGAELLARPEIRAAYLEGGH